MSGRGGERARRELHELLVVEGGGIWTDVLGVDPAIVSEAAVQRTPVAWSGRDADVFLVSFNCADCRQHVTLEQRYPRAPKFCVSCRAIRWPGSVRAEVERIGRVRTSRWPEMADRRRWWE